MRKWKCWKPEAASVLSSSHAKGERVRLLGKLSPRLVPTQGSVPPAHAVLQTKDLPADGPSISVPQRFSHLQASRASSHLIPHRLNGLENFTCSFIPQVFPLVCLSVKKWLIPTILLQHRRILGLVCCHGDVQDAHQRPGYLFVPHRTVLVWFFDVRSCQGQKSAL